MRSRPMSLLASALFLGLAPGIVAGVVPWWITRWGSGLASSTVDPLRMAGFLVACFGLVGLLDIPDT